MALFQPGCKHLVTHGQSKTPVYRIWSAMRRRCNNPNCAAYKDYGARGIKVCSRWDDFANFLADMGLPPKGMTLDRIDNDLGYTPDNCRWATVREQVLNRRNTKFYEIDGVRKPLDDWSKQSGVPYGTIWARIKKGWDVKSAIWEPVRADQRWHNDATAYGTQHGVQWSDATEHTQEAA